MNKVARREAKVEGQEVGMSFLPMVSDHLNAWDGRAVKLFRELARSVAKAHSKTYSVVLAMMMQRINMVIVKANAWSVLRSRSPLCELEVG